MPFIKRIVPLIDRITPLISENVQCIPIWTTVQNGHGQARRWIEDGCGAARVPRAFLLGLSFRPFGAFGRFGLLGHFVSFGSSGPRAFRILRALLLLRALRTRKPLWGSAFSLRPSCCSMGSAACGGWGLDNGCEPQNNSCRAILLRPRTAAVGSRTRTPLMVLVP